MKDDIQKCKEFSYDNDEDVVLLKLFAMIADIRNNKFADAKSDRTIVRSDCDF